MFAIAERANIPAEVWHLKTAYKANWGRMPEVLRRIEAARARGLDVTANMYPYDRASNGLDACLPLWVREGGTDAMLSAPAGSRDARSHQARHGRSERRRWRTSGSARAAARRDGRSVLDPALAQVGRQVLRRDRQGDGQGSARCGDGSRHRRQGGDVGHHLDHARSDVRRALRTRWCRSAPTRARAPKTARSRNPSRIRARGAPSRASSASTSATGKRAHAGRSRAQDDLAGRRFASASPTAACCGRA